MKTNPFMRSGSRRSTLAVGLITGVLFLTSANAQEQELPRSMTWGSYDVGASGYTEASAIADAFGRKYGTRVRVQPSGSSIGRMQPLVNGRTDYAFLATEAFFASEALYDFADRKWGPQNLCTLGGRHASGGLATAADANIRSISDLKGKRVTYIAGNPSINVKLDAMLAFGGMTRSDVEVVTFPTSAAALSSLAEGKADVTFALTTTGQMFELAQSPRGLHWVDIPPDDKAGWQKMDDAAPIFAPFEETIGAGVSVEKPVRMVAYRYPMVVVRCDLADDAAYTFIKALDETYDIYKSATPVMERWKISQSGTPPLDVPFHDGAIRYLKEKGVWTEDAQAWNDKRHARLDTIKTAWKKTLAEGDDLSDEEFQSLWVKRRAEALLNKS